MVERTCDTALEHFKPHQTGISIEVNVLPKKKQPHNKKAFTQQDLKHLGAIVRS